MSKSNKSQNREYNSQKINKTNSMPFSIDSLPKNLNNLNKEDIDFLKKIVKQKGLNFKDYLNKEVSLELSCYLKNTKVDISKLNENILEVLEGIVFKNRIQVKNLNIFIKDIEKDPFNSGSPFIGIVLRKIRKPTNEEIQNKRSQFEQIISNIRELEN